LKISELVLPLAKDEIEILSLPSDHHLQGLETDSRNIQLGYAYVAIAGQSLDGHQFILDAIQNGAAVLIVEKTDLVPKNYSGAIIKVKNTKKALNEIASHFYAHPTMSLWTFGVTGTNGKTSTVYIFEHLLKHLNVPTGVIGTIDHHLADKIWATNLTTPDQAVLQRRLWEMKNLGAKALAMEVSSHALDQKRVEKINFDAVLFTNLTRDHLDYHKNMQDYFEAKQKLFTEVLQSSQKYFKLAVINFDDPWARKLKVTKNSEVIRYGQTKNGEIDNLDFAFYIHEETLNGTRFTILSNFEKIEFHTPMFGTHNIYNLVGVLVTICSFGFSLTRCKDAVKTFFGAPGRLEPVKENTTVFVDYAHSPDALENVLKSVKPLLKDGRLLLVFGCGGDRDKGKRPLMAAVAEKYSDEVFVTSDNPRTENPDEIINDILKGFSDKFKVNSVHTETLRQQAIQNCLKKKSSNDLVIIAGKGHEKYQILGTEKIDFDDKEIARKYL